MPPLSPPDALSLASVEDPIICTFWVQIVVCICLCPNFVVLLRRFCTTKKVWTSVILGNSGFGSYRLQYTQKVHTCVRTFAISRKSILICRRLNYSSIKQMILMIHTCIYVFMFIPSQAETASPIPLGERSGFQSVSNKQQTLLINMSYKDLNLCDCKGTTNI